MTTKERIEELCKMKGITVAKLERDLDFSNGSISKPENLRSDRLMAVAKYFDVSMEYLMEGGEFVPDKIIIGDHAIELVPFQTFIEEFNPDTFNSSRCVVGDTAVNLSGLKEYISELTLLKKYNTLPDNVKSAIDMLLIGSDINKL